MRIVEFFSIICQKLSKKLQIGYEETPKKARSGKNFVDQEMSEMNAVVNKMAATNSKNHAELTRCVLFHKKIIELFENLKSTSYKL